MKRTDIRLAKSSVTLQKPDGRRVFFFALGLFFVLSATAGSTAQIPGQSVQTATPTPGTPQTPITLTSAQFIGQGGFTIERLIENAGDRRADLLAARQRLAIAQGRLVQAGLLPNPVLNIEYSSPRFLGGEAERDFNVGLSHSFELGGKRRKRIAVAEIELLQVRAEVLSLERQVSANLRKVYARAVASGRQLDAIEKLLVIDSELLRVTEARLNEGDVAPLDANLVRVESDRLRVRQIEARSELETALLEVRTLIGFDITDPLRLAPQAERPLRLDLGLSQLTATALSERADLQAAIIGERLSTARIDLAKSQAVPNVSGSVRFSRNRSILDFPPSFNVGSFPNTDNSLTFGAEIEIPIFNRNQGEIASATGEKVQAQRQREFLEATVKRDVAIAYRQYRAAAERLVLYATQILPRSEANLITVRAAYSAGEFSIFEVVNEQRRLTENITGYNQALLDYYMSLAQLEAALGIALPTSAFGPGATSVLPEKEIVPQVDKEKFLKSFEKNTRLANLTETANPKLKKE